MLLVIKYLDSTSIDVAGSHLQPKKQGNKNSVASRGRGLKNIEEEGVNNIGGLHKIGGLRAL